MAAGGEGWPRSSSQVGGTMARDHSRNRSARSASPIAWIAYIRPSPRPPPSHNTAQAWCGCRTAARGVIDASLPRVGGEVALDGVGDRTRPGVLRRNAGVVLRGLRWRRSRWSGRGPGPVLRHSPIWSSRASLWSFRNNSWSLPRAPNAPAARRVGIDSRTGAYTVARPTG